MKAVYGLAVVLFSLWRIDPLGAQPPTSQCKIESLGVGEVSGENFIAKVGDQTEILFISVFQSTIDEQAVIQRLFADSSLSYLDIVKSGLLLFAAEREKTQEVSSNVMFLFDRLTGGTVDFLVLDLPIEDLARLKTLARTIYFADFDYQLRTSGRSDESMKRLAQVSVGAPMFLQAYDPGLFGTMEVEGHAASPVTKKPRLKNDESAADQKYEELVDEFRHSARTRATFQRFAKQFKSGKFAGKSASEIKAEILPWVWSQARGKIGRWIDLELEEQRGARKQIVEKKETPEKKESPPDAIQPKPTITKPDQFIQTLLNRKGHGIVFEPADRFEAVKQAVSEFCK